MRGATDQTRDFARWRSFCRPGKNNVNARSTREIRCPIQSNDCVKKGERGGPSELEEDRTRVHARLLDDALNHAVSACSKPVYSICALYRRANCLFSPMRGLSVTYNYLLRPMAVVQHVEADSVLVTLTLSDLSI